MPTRRQSNLAEPLHVSGTKMAASILFFAPALFIGGFRDVFPLYQVDVGEGSVTR